MQIKLESKSASLKTTDMGLVEAVMKYCHGRGESVVITSRLGEEKTRTYNKRRKTKHPRWTGDEIFFLLDNIKKSPQWLAKQSNIGHTYKATASMVYKLKNPRFANRKTNALIAEFTELQNERLDY